MTFTLLTSSVSCERCGYNAQFNWDGHNVCGSGCHELLALTGASKSKDWLHLHLVKLIGNAQQEIQDAIGNTIREDEFIKIPSSTYSRYYPKSENWVIQLSKYHRDNLVWLFNAIGYGTSGVEPFTMANTGDWAGEIPRMLAKPNGSYTLDENDMPNRTIDDLKTSIQFWLKQKDK
jgi:hypothetical protein